MHGVSKSSPGSTWPPDHAPLVGRARGVLVAMLEQDVSAAIDEEHDGDPGQRFGHERPT